MIMNNLCTDIGYRSVNKNGEQLCGDHVELIGQGSDSVVMVLADGLGSGVKANILSTIAATLPVCEVRQVAYSTFTIIHIVNNSEAEIIQYDNPDVIMLRDGKNVEYPRTVMEIGGKNISRSKIPIQEGDIFIAMSDGAIHAGVGTSLNFGWERKNIIEFMEMMYDPDFTAKTLSTILLDECVHLYGDIPGDDTTISTVKVRVRKPVNLMIGPPASPDDVGKMMSLFFSKEGKHIVCGGTTSNLAAKFLGKTVQPTLGYLDPEIPPIAKIDGVDLTTEGVITINKVLTYANDYLSCNESYTDWSYKKDARLLFEEATDINFYVGKAINPAHQNPNLPINFSIKMRLVDELAEALRKMGKQIKVSHF